MKTELQLICESNVRCRSVSTNPRKRTAAIFWTSFLFFLTCWIIVPTKAIADPVKVSFTASDLGHSLWRYSYTLTGTYQAQDDLVIYFPVASSASLFNANSGASGFTSFVLQPDPSLPADGEFDAIANVNEPSLDTSFNVSFVYSGLGSPGSQAFSLYDPSFTAVDAGYTQPADSSAVPEPGSLALIGTGLLGLFKLIHRRA